MPTPTFTIRCLRNDRIAQSVHEMRFTKPEGFSFAPGQFVLFSVPSLNDPSDVQPRAYSIASTPDEKELLFVIKLKAGGRAGMWVEQHLKEGMDVKMQGPMGVFSFDPEWEGGSLFVCTGVGIAPFRSMVLSALGRAYAKSMDLCIGCYSQEHLFWLDTFQRLAAQHGNFRFHVALSDPREPWEGNRGYVQSIVPHVVPDFAQRSIYACGNPVMTVAVKELALGVWGIPKNRFHMEGYV